MGRGSGTFERLLDKATSQLLLETDWESILQICDLLLRIAVSLSCEQGGPLPSPPVLACWLTPRAPPHVPELASDFLPHGWAVG
uniref:Hepatocyte growth factor-regulated tyrosine kinase substrate n=1 Tax=Molossus molossus TaxID=27622 RepID=A0A7J8CY86_MOLMO|nr:hepatocyte growth factor-regulated tyrosine kinase substrate [Molossus molossus]